MGMKKSLRNTFRSLRFAGIPFPLACKLARAWRKGSDDFASDLLESFNLPGVVIQRIPHSCSIHDICWYEIYVTTRRGKFRMEAWMLWPLSLIPEESSTFIPWV